MKPQLSILIITRNERRRLPRLFDSLGGLKLPLEILVLDSESQDGTRNYARRRGARVKPVKWEGYARTKNRGFGLCRAPWILSLDADESLTPELGASIRAALRSTSGPRGYSVCRLNHFLGRAVRHGGWYPDWQLRLFKKNAARFNDREVHEGMEMQSGQGDAGRLKGALMHDSYPDLTGYFARLNRYTTLQARELFEKRGARPAAAFFHALADPPLVFIKMLIFKLGFLDGGLGLAVAALSASSTFWKYAKYWHLSWKARGGNAGEPWVLGHE